MMKQESNEIGSEENNRARACDTCQSKPCTVYCHADSAYLCTSCDAQVHSANRVASRHKRVPVCESCERAPAAFLCEADDASLCTVCDAEVHSANPLARRHQRVPILPITGNSYSFMATHHKSETTIPNLETNRRAVDQERGEKHEEDAKQMVSWLLPNSYKNSGDHKSEKAIANPENRWAVDQEGGKKGEKDAKEMVSWLLPNSYKNSGDHNNSNQDKGLLSTDDYLDFADYNSSMDYKFTGQYNQQECNVPQTTYGGDRVVPLQFEESRCHLNHKEQNFQCCKTYGSSGSHCGVGYNGSTNHNAYISSMETSVVPESTAHETAAPHPGTPKGTINQLPDPPKQMIIPMNREARVLRYKEKKKTRKFEKTIRYASRKAYAERRPRINGRFAKRTEIEAEEDQRFNTMVMYNTGYGIVPSF